MPSAMKQRPEVDITQSVSQYMNVLLQTPREKGGAGMNKDQAKMAMRYASEIAASQRTTFTQTESKEIKRAGINSEFVLSLGNKMKENLTDTDQNTRKTQIAQYQIGQANYSPGVSGKPMYKTTCEQDIENAKRENEPLVMKSSPKKA
jgi:hypothetical protein